MRCLICTLSDQLKAAGLPVVTSSITTSFVSSLKASWKWVSSSPQKSDLMLFFLNRVNYNSIGYPTYFNTYLVVYDRWLVGSTRTNYQVNQILIYQLVCVWFPLSVVLCFEHVYFQFTDLDDEDDTPSQPRKRQISLGGGAGGSGSASEKKQKGPKRQLLDDSATDAIKSFDDLFSDDDKKNE